MVVHQVQMKFNLVLLPLMVPNDYILFLLYTKWNLKVLHNLCIAYAKGTKLFQWVSSVPVHTVTSFLICVTWLIYRRKGEKHSFPTKLEPCVFMLIWPSYSPHNKSVPNIGTLLSITVSGLRLVCTRPVFVLIMYIQWWTKVFQCLEHFCCVDHNLVKSAWKHMVQVSLESYASHLSDNI